eukprot:1764990-Prymnesium_polylepis.1
MRASATARREGGVRAVWWGLGGCCTTHTAPACCRVCRRRDGTLRRGIGPTRRCARSRATCSAQRPTSRSP